MYRDDEVAATLQMQKIEAKLLEELNEPVSRLRPWRYSYFHPFVITGLLFSVVSLLDLIGGEGFWGEGYSYSSSSGPGTLALLLGPLLAAVVGALFYGLQQLLARARVSGFSARYGPPPKNLKPSDRIPLLEGRLQELKEFLQENQRGDQ